MYLARARMKMKIKIKIKMKIKGRESHQESIVVSSRTRYTQNG